MGQTWSKTAYSNDSQLTSIGFLWIFGGLGSLAESSKHEKGSSSSWQDRTMFTDPTAIQTAQTIQLSIDVLSICEGTVIPYFYNLSQQISFWKATGHPQSYGFVWTFRWKEQTHKHPKMKTSFEFIWRLVWCQGWVSDPGQAHRPSSKDRSCHNLQHRRWKASSCQFTSLTQSPITERCPRQESVCKAMDLKSMDWFEIYIFWESWYVQFGSPRFDSRTARLADPFKLSTQNIMAGSTKFTKCHGISGS